MWEARAEYADGTTVERMYDYTDSRLSDGDIQYALEEWLITRHDGCVWYSVNYVGPFAD